jgi:aminopeptidase S
VRSATHSALRDRIRVVLVLVAVVLFAGCAPNASPDLDLRTDGQLVKDLSGKVSGDAAMVHLRALQRIADENGGNRATPGAGYDASIDYVVGVLRAAGFDVSTPNYEVRGEHHDDSVQARNVVAQTRTGDPNRVVIIGAHLDSVTKGPGIVDNGSGVATLLEIANQLGASPPVANAVRFAFFGSEEAGKQGSRGYVNGLSPEDRAKILLYLNVDMVASSNGGYFVQGGKGVRKSKSGPPGSATVARVLADRLESSGVVAENIEFASDDETAFIDANIPVGGAENGDRKKKSEEQAKAWGGKAGEVFDPCYHSACDRLDNVNREVLDRYLRAIAGTVAYFANSNQKPQR